MKIAKKKYRIVTLASSSVFFLVLHYFFDFNVFPDSMLGVIPTLKKITIVLSVIFAILLARMILERLIDRMEHKEGEHYNLLRVIRLVALIVIALVIASFMFQRPYAALTGLGIVSLVVGFALQAPITSFIGWLYIIFRRPYQVGDRIQIGVNKGDVVEISYLDTIIQEVRGEYLGNDRNSGRIIHFPNSMILTDKVINYSGQFARFIWDETAVQISYNSNLEFVEDCLVKAAINDFKKRFPELDEKEYLPTVYFRVNTYSWLEAVVSYAVEPKDTTGRRNRILKNALAVLNQHPDKVGFPEGAKR